MKLKLAKLEDITLERMVAVRAITATDGVSSRLLWENPLPGPTEGLFLKVAEVTDESVTPLNRRITELLLAAEQNSPSDIRIARLRGD